MSPHCRPVRALNKGRFGVRSVMMLVLLAVLGEGSPAFGAAGNRADKNGDVDTEHMFGFTEGSDIGAKGERELETDSTGRFGRLGGSYNNVADAAGGKYSLPQ